jgi:hypothetical protein
MNMDYLEFLEKSDYSNKIINYLKMDIERINESESNCLFTNLEFPLNESYLLFEPRVAMLKPTRYYQNLRIDDELKRLDWSAGSTRALGFNKNRIIFISKAVMKNVGEKEKIDHYVAIELNKNDLNITEENNMLTISLDKEVNGKNIKTGLNEKHKITFSFNFVNNERAIMPKHMAKRTMYGRSSISQTSQIMSKFENYTITVLHFAPHPILIQHYKEFGFEGPIDFQRNCFSMLKELLKR